MVKGPAFDEVDVYVGVVVVVKVTVMTVVTVVGAAVIVLVVVGCMEVNAALLTTITELCYAEGVFETYSCSWCHSLYECRC